MQVNRLGNPLINEVIIPTGLKDIWNAQQPWRRAVRTKYYKTPILAAVINKLYKLGAPETGRDDLVAVLLTGVPKLNYTGPKAADVLRLNLGSRSRQARTGSACSAGTRRAGRTAGGSTTT